MIDVKTQLENAKLIIIKRLVLQTFSTSSKHFGGEQIRKFSSGKSETSDAILTFTANHEMLDHPIKFGI